MEELDACELGQQQVGQFGREAVAAGGVEEHGWHPHPYGVVLYREERGRRAACDELDQTSDKGEV